MGMGSEGVSSNLLGQHQSEINYLILKDKEGWDPHLRDFDTLKKLCGVNE